MIEQTALPKVPRGATRRKEYALLALVFVLVVLSRIPFQARFVESFDAVNYMLAIDHFDMRLSQPQPPGYILYILLARAANSLAHDPHTALLWVSAVFSGVGVVAIYLAGREIFNARVGAVSAALLACAPLFWYTGGSAVPYAPDLAFATLAVWLAYRAMHADQRGVPWAAAISLGLAGAFRLQTLIFLFPLFVYALRKLPWPRFAAGIATAGAVFSAFFLPSVMVSGGIRGFLDSFFAIIPALSSSSPGSGSGLPQRLLLNAAITGRHTLAAMGEFLLPLALTGLIYLPEKKSARQQERGLFLLLWVAPTWLVCLLIGPGNVGTIQVTTGPYYLLAAVAIVSLILHPRYQRLGWALLAVILFAHTWMFTRMPYRPFGEHYRAFYTYDTLRSTEADYRQKLAIVRAYPSDQTVVIAREFRLIQYYLPQYRALSVPTFDPSTPDRIASIITVRHNQVEYRSDVLLEDVLPPSTQYLIFYDLHLIHFPLDQVELKAVSSGNVTVHVLELDAHQHLRWTASGIATTP
jgi:hypothetical protein